MSVAKKNIFKIKKIIFVFTIMLIISIIVFSLNYLYIIFLLTLI